MDCQTGFKEKYRAICYLTETCPKPKGRTQLKIKILEKHVLRKY